ncbi:hypothetical protein BSA16_02410, partial [Micromonospora sp. Rc5]
MPLLGRHRAAGGSFRRVVGAHRAPGSGAPGRGYLFTVALLAGTASMPILAAISTGSATVGSTALPDSSTPFIPTRSVGPVIVPATGQPATAPSTPPGTAAVPQPELPGPGLPPPAPAPIVPAASDRSDPEAVHRPPPRVPT